MLVELVQYDTDGLIELLDHPRIDRAVLNLTDIETPVEKKTLPGESTLFRFVTVFLPQCLCGLDWSVHGVKG